MHWKKTASIFAVLILAISCDKKKIDTSKKVLNYSLEAEIEGFDPIMATDEYSTQSVLEVYETLLEFEYLKRPYELRPGLVERMPEVSADGKTYTFTLRPGIFFQTDPVFQGKPRALVAADVIYSFQRLADPATKSPNYWVFENKIEGLDAFREKLAGAPRPIAYEDFPVSGLQAPDDRTVVIRLTEPSPIILYSLAMVSTAIVAKEVVEKYGAEFVNHPVGTGPFALKEWKRNQKITFVRNPNYWGSAYPTEGETSDAGAGLLAASGKKLPFIDELVFWIHVERQPMWLNFLKGNLDFAPIPKEAFDNVFDAAGNMREDMKKRGLRSERQIGVDLVFQIFNLADPVIGKNIHLRRAISMATDRVEKNKLFYNNRAIEAMGPIPPGIFGYDEALKNPNGLNLEAARREFELAKALHQKNFGDKTPLKVTLETSNNPASRQLAEAFIADFQRLGLNADLQVYTFASLGDRMKKSQGQMYSYAWYADYPDAENFFQLLYGKSVSPGPNHANFQNKEFDRLFDKMRNMPNGPERLVVIREMVRIFHAEVPWNLFNHRISVAVSQPWLKNFKRHNISPAYFKYLDVDMQEKAKTLSRAR